MEYRSNSDYASIIECVGPKDACNDNMIILRPEAVDGIAVGSLLLMVIFTKNIENKTIPYHVHSQSMIPNSIYHHCHATHASQKMTSILSLLPNLLWKHNSISGLIEWQEISSEIHGQTRKQFSNTIFSPSQQVCIN